MECITNRLHTPFTQECHFEWPWVILGDLAVFNSESEIFKDTKHRAVCLRAGKKPRFFGIFFRFLGFLMGTGNYSAHRIIWSWYTGRWWVGCYIWYSEEGTGRGPSVLHHLLPSRTHHSYKLRPRRHDCFLTVNPPTHTVLFSGQPEISCTILSPLSLGPT